jgi:hypothetical protein
MTTWRGTSNANVRGNAAQRAKRRAAVVARDGWPEHRLVLCARCEVPLLQDEDPEAPGQSMTLDRRLPGCLGGTYDLDNIRAYCGPCNTETGGRLGVARRQGYLTASGILDSGGPP